MKRLGRPPKGEDRMVAISIRLPKQLIEKYRQADKPNALMREALQTFILTYTPERDKHS